MALPLPPGLTPPEVAFLCEMELITVVPRQRLEGLALLGGPTPPLIPPRRTNLPLWLALLLSRQRRAQILPPPWLSPHSLTQILETEKLQPSFSASTPLPASPSRTPLSPPFLAASSTDAAPADTLPYHWLEVAELVLDAMAQDGGAGTGAGEGARWEDEGVVRGLVRDLREVRMAKLRKGIGVLEGGREVVLSGVGGMEVCAQRGFVGGVVDGLRKIGASKEVARKEREAEERENGGPDRGGSEGEDEDGMSL